MDSLFSHAPNPDENFAQPADSEPSREQRFEVRVPVETDQAFEGFTAYPHLWWPTEFTAFGSGTHVSIDDEAMGEESDNSGQWLEWGVIGEFVPAEHLELTWTIDPVAHVHVAFQPAGPSASTVVVNITGATLLKREADGIVRAVDWDRVLGFYARFMGADLPAQMVEEGN